MKSIFAIILFFSLSTFAGSVHITSNDDGSGSKLSKLAHVPQQMIGILTDAGLKFEDFGYGVKVIRAKNLHCDFRHRGAVEGTLSGVPTLKCRVNSEDKQDSKKGQALSDSRALSDLLSEIQTADIGVAFSDCAMGYCGTFAKSILCSVDTKIEEFTKGRFSCVFYDGSWP